MRDLSGSLVCAAVFASTVLVTGCGAKVVGDNPGPKDPGYPECGDIVACDPQAPTKPAPTTPPNPGDTTPSSSDVTGCVTTLEDDFNSGVWSSKWWRLAVAPDPTSDRMFVTPDDFPGHGRVLQVEGPASSTGYVASSSPKIHTTCFPKKAHFGFDYRVDDGSIDSSREDHAEIGEITGLDSTGVRCSVLFHVMQGRLRATTGPNLDLGAIAAATWARVDVTIEGAEATFERDGQSMGTLALRCVLSDDLVRFGVSGGRSYAPGTYRAYFDNVSFGPR